MNPRSAESQLRHLPQTLHKPKNPSCLGCTTHNLPPQDRGLLYGHIVAQEVACHQDTPNFCVGIVFGIYRLRQTMKFVRSEREGLLVTQWLTESSTYQPWQSSMVSHIAVDQFNSWDTSINMSPPDQHMDLDILRGKNILYWTMSLNCAVDQLLYGIPS